MSLSEYLSPRIKRAPGAAALTLITFALLALSAKPATAQWTADGNNINNTNSGNVGVGTTAPSTKLHVAGGIYSSQVIESANSNGFRLVVSGPGDTRASWAYNGGTTTTRLTGAVNVRTSLGSNGVDDRLFLDLSGRVGIGTITPTSKLHLLSGTDSATTLFHLDTGVHGGTAFAVSGTANNESGFDVSVYRSGQYFSRFGVSTAGNLYLQPGGGSVGIGTASPTSTLHVVGSGFFTGSLTVNGNLAAKYQDVAEWVESSQELTAGTVVVLDATRSNQVIASTQAYDSRVAGVVSSRPGLVLGEQGEGRVMVATTGRVKVKVDASEGPIEIGDLLVTSDTEGVAMKSVAVEVGGVRIHRPGTLLGKALEPLAHGTGEILVLLSMQ